MIDLAISILWLALGVIILGAVVWIFLWAIRRVFPGMPLVVDQVVWAAFGILVLIYVLMAISGRSPSFRLHSEAISGRAIAAISTTTSGHLQGMLS